LAPVKGVGVKRWQIALLAVFVLALLGKAIGPSKEFQKKYPRNGLTDEQLLGIVDDCNHHPDALRCH